MADRHGATWPNESPNGDAHDAEGGLEDAATTHGLESAPATANVSSTNTTLMSGNSKRPGRN